MQIEEKKGKEEGKMGSREMGGGEWEKEERRRETGQRRDNGK